MKNKIIFLLTFLPLLASSQIFEQNFVNGSRYNTYVGKEVNQFDVISNYGNAPVSIDNGVIKWNKKASSSAFFTKSANLESAKFLKAEFTLALSSPEELNNYSDYRATFFIGGGNEAAWVENSSPASPSSVFARVAIKPIVSDSKVSFSIYNSEPFTARQNITIYANNTGGFVKYVGPDSKENTLPNRSYDVYVGETKVLNGAKSPNTQADLSMFKFVYPSNAPNATIEIGNFLFTEMANDDAIVKVEQPKQIIDKDSSILLGWQFTYPQETSGREIAFLATTNHPSLETGILSRGFNAAPGAGSKRGFTGLFPIENSRQQAEVSGSYYEVNINPKKNETVSLKSIQSTIRRQKESPYIYRWTYSLDGKTFKNIGDNDIIVNDLNSWGIQQPNIDLSNYADLQNIKNPKKVLLRMYVWGATTDTGHDRSFGFGKSSNEGSNVLAIKGQATTSSIKMTQEIKRESDKLWISEVKYQDPKTGIYLGSPSILKLNNGNLLAALDYFGPNRYRDSLNRSNRTSVYLSEDDGKTWKHISDINGMYWGTLFEHNNEVYLLGNNAGMGSIVILKSTNHGFDWTKAENDKSGLLFKAGENGNAPRYHGAPTPVLKHNGRIYRAFENAEDLTLKGMRGYRAFVISINENDNLLDASKWIKSNELAFSGTWDRAGSFPTTGWLEGNIVEGENGALWDILRVNSTPFFDRAAMVKIENNGKNVSFDQKKDFISLPGGQSKFVIRKDKKSGFYWAIVNNNTDPTESSQRNVLSLYASKNLRDWYHSMTLMQDDQKISSKESIKLTGFQYPDWQFDGADIIYLTRTAYGENVPRYHDSNRITFGRVVDFNTFLPEELK